MSAATCAWCRGELGATARRYCSKKCRQTAFRLRKQTDAAGALERPMRFAYADPPYPKLSARYYKHEPSFAGEVDHVALVRSLLLGGYHGWALSTSSKALRDVLPLCPPSSRVCAWVKPIGAATRSAGIHSTWEPVIVYGGRQRPPGKRD